MSNTEQPSHNHKRVGLVVVLELTAELARIRELTAGDEFWVKRTDLTELIDGVVQQSKPSTKEARAGRVKASPARARRAA